jgi:alpha-D-ribose 1-methylphosphonate 5-triphosphate synthase subunit PhnH
VIEGLRVAPAYLDARADGSVPKSCEECKRNNPVTTRQYMGCGFEEPVDDARPWAPSYMATTACPGYAVELPMTREVFSAHVQWKHGTLPAFLDGEQPTSVALHCLGEFEAGINEHSAAKVREASEKARQR